MSPAFIAFITMASFAGISIGLVFWEAQRADKAAREKESARIDAEYRELCESGEYR